ncbi:class F sortase [Streptomyces sp. NPDC059443]|uniref:class F sortase n=1 Tax=unclassified Streptomyces TaxID=2593676 RepID=UPI00369C9491
MPRAKWVVGVLTVTLLSGGIVVLHSTEGARPTSPTAGDALPSRVLGLSGPRRLARQLDHSDEHTTGKGTRRPARAGVAPLPAARPLRLVIRSLRIDVPLTGGTPVGGAGAGPDLGDGGAVWNSAGPAPGAAGTAEVSGEFLRLAGLRRGQTVEILRSDRRTAVFTVYRVSPFGLSERGGSSGKAQLRLISGETAVIARLTGHRRTPR